MASGAGATIGQHGWQRGSWKSWLQRNWTEHRSARPCCQRFSIMQVWRTNTTASTTGADPLMSTAGQAGLRLFEPEAYRSESSLSNFSTKLGSWSGWHDFVQSILMLPDGLAVSGGDSGKVGLHRLGGEKLLHSLYAHEAAVMCLGADLDSNIFTGSVDRMAKQWDLAGGGRLKSTCVGHSRSVHCLTTGTAASNGSAILLTGSRDHTIKFWDLRTVSCQHTLRGHTGSVTCLGVDGWKVRATAMFSRAPRVNVIAVPFFLLSSSRVVATIEEMMTRKSSLLTRRSGCGIFASWAQPRALSGHARPLHRVLVRTLQARGSLSEIPFSRCRCNHLLQKYTML